MGLVGVVAPVVEVGLGVGVADAFLPLGFVDVGIGGGPRADDADVLDADARVEVGAEVGGTTSPYPPSKPTFSTAACASPTARTPRSSSSSASSSKSRAAARNTHELHIQRAHNGPGNNVSVVVRG